MSVVIHSPQDSVVGHEHMLALIGQLRESQSLLEARVDRLTIENQETGGALSRLEADRDAWKSRLDRMSKDLRKAGLTASIRRQVGELSRQTGFLPEVILRRALELFRIALEADRAGHRVSVLDEEDTILREIVGVGEPTLLPTESASSAD